MQGERAGIPSQHWDQILTDIAAEAAVGGVEDFLPVELLVGNNKLIVYRYCAEFVLNHSDPLAMILG